ncbi:MAG TPA: helix-turn-helix domain-containing protein, partial [Candidatus Acidoferrales bacterium]
RAVILAQGSVLELEPDLVPSLPPADSSSSSDRSSGVATPLASRPYTPVTLEEIERGHIMSVLSQTRGVVEGPRGAAKILGLHPNTLRHRIQKLGLKRSTYRES